MIWKTREGIKMKPKDMTESHIRNCIAMLQRNIDRAEDSRPWYGGDADGAWWAADCEDRLIDTYVSYTHGIIKTFEDELLRRANLSSIRIQQI